MGISKKLLRYLFPLFLGTIILAVSGTTVTGAPDSDFDSVDCLDCHDDTSPDVFSDSPVDIGEQLAIFVHADADCTDCHSDIVELPHGDELAPVNCGNCHDEITETFNSSAHSTTFNGRGNSSVSDKIAPPTCGSCHGDHLILSPLDSLAKTFSENLPKTCSGCHNSETSFNDPDIRVADQTDQYLRGIHATELAAGNDSSATCSDCHAVHDLRRVSDVRSKVNKMNIPKTCSACHGEIYAKYSRGIHGKALAAGILDSPNCTDCHGEHEILPIADSTSSVNAANLSDYVCGKCHNDPEMAKKFELNDERFTSYQDSYHGLALKGGSVKAANCVSCHNAHEILPESNPASSINLDNRTETCAKCHPKANETFASSYTHQLEVPKQQSANEIVRIVYIVLIVLVISGMVIHNLIILLKFIREKKSKLKEAPSIARFTGNMVFQHTLLATSFIVLAITGFALCYPDGLWVSILNFLGIFESERSTIHRISAIILIYISLHHLVFILLYKRGRSELKSFMPNLRDLADVVTNMKYHLGLSSTKPKFAKYDYTEKAEYWAVVWGTMIMAITGLVLWFPIFFTSFLPAWVVKISETVHLYEAWLATLAIGVFHLFFVIFHPQQYPMSLTWMSGKMSEEEAKDHHPLWYEQLKKEEAEQARLKEAESQEDSTQEETNK